MKVVFSSTHPYPLIPPLRCVCSPGDKCLYLTSGNATVRKSWTFSAPCQALRTGRALMRHLLREQGCLWNPKVLCTTPRSWLLQRFVCLRTNIGTALQISRDFSNTSMTGGSWRLLVFSSRLAPQAPQLVYSDSTTVDLYKNGDTTLALTPSFRS